MTFFANSGIRFPDLEEQTRAAGTESLKGGAELLDVIAALESSGQRKLDQTQLESIAQSFTRASNAYAGLVLPVAEYRLARPLDADIELAYGSHIWSYYWRERLPSAIPDLYRDLSIRLGDLANMVTDINLEKKPEQLVPLIFKIWNDWEDASALGRLISLINRRPNP